MQVHRTHSVDENEKGTDMKRNRRPPRPARAGTAAAPAPAVASEQAQPVAPKSVEGGNSELAAPCSPLPAPCSAGASPFPCFPGETPRAFGAFVAFFRLGHRRSLQAVADQLGESPATVKNWSSKYHWADRIQSFNSGLLQQQAEAEAAARRQQTADWARRTNEQREREWAAAQKLLAAAQCFLESFGDREVEKMNHGQVSRALQVSSRMARLALSGATGPEEPSLAPLQMELAAALKKAYAQPPPAVEEAKP
jgi:hypothetical protein